MSNYFKDKKLVLFYMATEKGLPIQLFPRFVYDDDSGRSLIISVRGGPMSEDSFHHRQLEIDMPNGKSEVWAEKNLCDYLCGLSEDELNEFKDRSIRNSDVLDEVKLHWSDVTVRKVMVLAYSDGSSVEEIEKELIALNLDFQLIKIGGVELAVEFLLSDFCITEFHRRKLKPEFDSELDVMLARPDGSTDPDFGYEPGYDWSISNLGNIEAPEYFEDFDDGEFYKSSPRLYYYSFDLKALSKLHELLHVPYRVEKLLTEDQKLTLKNEAPTVLLEEVDYIARKVFNLPLDDFKEDQYRSYMAARSAAWNSEMYDVLGGDGRQSAYLGSGVSISPSGKLIDD